MTPSPQQQAVVSWVTSSSGHASVRARAGSGKTSLLKLVASAIPMSGNRVLALSFSKEAATQLATKLPFYVESSTFHSYWFASLRSAFGNRIKVDDKKSQWTLKDLLPNWQERSEVQSVVLKLVGFAKGAGWGCDGIAVDMDELALHYGLDVTPRHIHLATQILERAACETTRIDFDDMLWLPLKHNLCPNSKATFLLVDEAQDTNVVQKLLLPRMLAPNGRLLIVGDEYQAIYGFRGAGHDSMEQLEQLFSMQVFTLSVSYRCSKSVIEETRKYLGKPLTKPKREHAPVLTNRFAEDAHFDDNDWDARERYGDLP